MLSEGPFSSPTAFGSMSMQLSSIDKDGIALLSMGEARAKASRGIRPWCAM